MCSMLHLRNGLASGCSFPWNIRMQNMPICNFKDLISPMPADLPRALTAELNCNWWGDGKSLQIGLCGLAITCPRGGSVFRGFMLPALLRHNTHPLSCVWALVLHLAICGAR